MGYALILIGLMMFVFTGINFITTKKVVDIGPIQIDKEESVPIQWSPFVGIALVLGGIGLVVRNKNAKTKIPV